MYIDQSVAGLKYKMCVPGSKFHWAGLQGIFFCRIIGASARPGREPLREKIGSL